MRNLPVVLCAMAAIGLGAASAAQAALLPPLVAPGRVALDVNGGELLGNVDGGGAAHTIALPDGGALLIGGQLGSAYVTLVARIDRAGHPVTSFGDEGVLRLDFSSRKLALSQALRAPDGRLLLVMTGQATDINSLAPLFLVRLNADGSLDGSFGSGGFAPTGVTAGCVNLCTTAAFDPAGRIVVTGTTGHVSPTPPPGDFSGLRWVIARFTPSGAPDGTFGSGGVVTMPQAGGNGYNVAVLADNRIVAEGQVGPKPGDTSMQLTRLQGDGSLDPAFGGGITGEVVVTPIAAGFPMLVGPDGAVAIAGLQSTGSPGGHQLIVRYSAAGTPQPGFGNKGVVDLGTVAGVNQLLPGVNGDLIAVLQQGVSGLAVQRLNAAGGVTMPLALPTPFGGGESSFLVSKSPRPLPSLSQNSFTGRRLTQRPDGSYIVGGGVSVRQPTGEGVGYSIFRFAAASLTPVFTADNSFGGPAVTPRVSATFLLQRRTTAYSRHGIRIRLKSSAPGLARVYIRAAGHTVAQSVVPVFGTRTATIPVELTKTGNTLLHHSSRRLHVSMTVSLHDLVATRGSTSAVGALR